MKTTSVKLYIGFIAVLIHSLLPAGSFDVVIIVAALMVGHVPVCVVRQLCDACKPGEPLQLALQLYIPTKSNSITLSLGVFRWIRFYGVWA